MSSVLRFLKQIPVDTQYFVSISASPRNLSMFFPDPAASTTSYVSGAAAGHFSTATVTVASATDGDISGVGIFRDMGKTIVSSGRTFRRVQLLTTDGNGSTGWTTSGGTPGSTAGVWQAGINGVTGATSTTGTDDGYNVYYFETGARGLGIAQGLIRYG